MFSNDFLSRIKNLKQRRARGFGELRNKILRQWIILLIISVFVLMASVAFAGYRYVYWSNIEEHVLSSGVEGKLFDQEKVEKILVEYDEKADRSLKIMTEVELSNESVSTTTVASSSVPELVE